MVGFLIGRLLALGKGLEMWDPEVCSVSLNAYLDKMEALEDAIQDLRE